MNKLFLRRSVFVKRFTHEMTLREMPGSEARTTYPPAVDSEVGGGQQGGCPDETETDPDLLAARIVDTLLQASAYQAHCRPGTCSAPPQKAP